MSFEETLAIDFPTALKSANFVKRASEALQAYGFRASNAIACVSVCRDELTRPFVEEIQNSWDRVFDFSSLASMLYLGRTGFEAANHHAPNEGGVERMIYFAFPHIGIDSAGEIGNCFRSGRTDVSHACGALFGLQRELANGPIKLDLDSDDIEHSILKQRLFRKLIPGEAPDLLTLTMKVRDVILEDLERMIHLTVDTTRSHYAVLTGIQIHGPNNQTFIWPGVMYAVVNQKRLEFSSALSESSSDPFTLGSQTSHQEIPSRNRLMSGILSTNSLC